MRIKLEYCPLADLINAISNRVFAHTGHKRLTICVSKNFYKLPKSKQRGIILHEIGHIIAGSDELSADLVGASLAKILNKKYLYKGLIQTLE